jgi:hypothetical protein
MQAALNSPGVAVVEAVVDAEEKPVKPDELRARACRTRPIRPKISLERRSTEDRHGGDRRRHQITAVQQEPTRCPAEQRRHRHRSRDLAGDAESRDVLVPPSTEGLVPNLRFSFADAHMNLQSPKGG